MYKLHLTVLTSAFLSGCVAPPQSSAVDDNFGNAFKQSITAQYVHPTARKLESTQPLMDGQAAKSSIDRYQKSFETPATPSNVFNTGTGVGFGNH